MTGGQSVGEKKVLDDRLRDEEEEWGTIRHELSRRVGLIRSLEICVARFPHRERSLDQDTNLAKFEGLTEADLAGVDSANAARLVPRFA
jgi:hypothetical protein